MTTSKPQLSNTVCALASQPHAIPPQKYWRNKPQSHADESQSTVRPANPKDLVHARRKEWEAETSHGPYESCCAGR